MAEKTVKNPKGAGRKSKLTEELIANIGEALSNGSGIAACCNTFKIDVSTWFDWHKKGKKNLETNREYLTELQKLMVRFYQIVEENIITRRQNESNYTPELLAYLIDGYFNECDSKKITIKQKSGEVKKPRPYTITGLQIYLGLSDKTWSYYAQKEDYAAICALAKLRCENYLVEQGLTGGLNTIMSIFILKNNFGYSDQVSLEIQPKEPLKLYDIKQMLEEKKKGNKVIEGEIIEGKVLESKIKVLPAKFKRTKKPKGEGE